VANLLVITDWLNPFSWTDRDWAGVGVLSTIVIAVGGGIWRVRARSASAIQPQASATGIGTVVVQPAVPPPAIPPAPISSPFQLPRDISDFVGRLGEVEQIKNALTAVPRTALPIVVVHGDSAIGKSALAVRACHAARQEYPDGHLYIDMRGSSNRPRPAEDATASLLWSLGIPPEAIPQDAERLEVMYRSHLFSTRTMVLLDDVRDHVQVTPLLPGSPDCAVVITSRSPLHELPATSRIPLGPLPSDQGLALLRLIVGDAAVDEDLVSAEALVSATGGSPLAIRLAASSLGGP
jgi:hypothetical protein